MTRRIVIIGGGVIGTSVAWHLAVAAAGDITLVERDRLGAGTTWHSAGNITWLAYNDRQILATFDAVKAVSEESGQDVGWLKTGRLVLARDDATLESFADSASLGEERGYGSQMLSPAEAAKHHPLLDPAAIAGAWLNGLSGRLDPAGLTAAYAGAARKRGVTIRESCAVTGITSNNDHVTGIETSDGAIPADAVVVCGGLWSRRLLAGCGIALAQWGNEHFYVIARMDPVLDRTTPSFVSPDFSIYGREEVGGLLFGCFDKNALTLDGDNGAPQDDFSFSLLNENWDKFAPYAENAAILFPALVKAPISRFVNGPETFTPDDQPLIGLAGDVEGLYVASAMNSGGVTYSGYAGQLISDLVTGADPRFEPARYAPTRFGTQAGDEAWLRETISQVPSSRYRELHD
jgi:glycine/D-amino acid oxidase-like deaminating enzyme